MDLSPYVWRFILVAALVIVFGAAIAFVALGRRVQAALRAGSPVHETH